MMSMVEFLIKVMLGSFSMSGIRDDLATVDLLNTEYRQELTDNGFQLVFVNDWRVELFMFHGTLFVRVHVPYTPTTIPCGYSGMVCHHLRDEARVLYAEVVDQLLVA